MTMSNAAARLALLLGLVGGCSGTIDAALGPVGEDSAVPGTPDKPSAGGGPKAEERPSTIGTQVFALCEGGEEAPSPRLLRLLTPREYQNTLRSLLYLQQADVSNLPLPPRVRGYDNNASASVVTSRHIDEYLNASAKLIDEALNEQRGQLLPCQSNDASCARMFVTKFGLRAFRRPLESDEVERYAALFASDLTGGSFDQGVKLAIGAMLISPHFIYRSEVGEAQADGTYKLTQYEVASALAYTYWGTMPDQALFDAAAKKELSSAQQLEAQARRMLNDARAREQLAGFALQWLGSDATLSAFKDKGIYPAFSDSLRMAMLEEQQRFVTDVVLTRDGKFEELYLADYVFANGELARFYGLSGGNEFSKVSATPQSQRGGILGLGAVLAAHAHSNESSPVKRGKFVRDRLLCQDLPPPPPNLDTTPPGLDPTLTTRARFAKHTSDAACASCHQFIDGVGFGFEGFDGIGARRTTENGMPVDESGQLVGRDALSDKTKQPFVGIRELSASLAESATAQSCFALQYYRYARGYEETNKDACSLDKLRTRFEESDLTVKEVLVNLALLDSFTVRRGG